MRKLAIAAACLALAACNNQDNAVDADTGADGTQIVDAVDPGADAGFEAVAPGSYEVRHADGSIDQLTILPGMTWAMVFANGDAAGGTIFAQDGQNCFVTEGVEGHQCFTAGETAASGAMQVTADGGEVMTVTPVESFG